MKRTLKRELNRPEIAAREAIETSKKPADIYRISVCPCSGAPLGGRRLYGFFFPIERVRQWLAVLAY
jgi:hypothetical protein